MANRGKFRFGDWDATGRYRYFPPACALGSNCTKCMRWLLPSQFDALGAASEDVPAERVEGMCDGCGAPVPRLERTGRRGRPRKYQTCSPPCKRRVYIKRGPTRQLMHVELPGGAEHLTPGVAAQLARRDAPKPPDAPMRHAVKQPEPPRCKDCGDVKTHCTCAFRQPDGVSIATPGPVLPNLPRTPIMPIITSKPAARPLPEPPPEVPSTGDFKGGKFLP